MNARTRTMELEAANAQLVRTSTDLAATLTALEASNARLEEEISGRARVEAELRLAHRLEAVGQLAAGVAHEINTPIQYISDSVRFLETAFADLLPVIAQIAPLARTLRANGDAASATALEASWSAADGGFAVEQIPPAISRTLAGIERVAAIVRAMKAFSHPGSESRAASDLNDALRTTLEVCRNEYKYVADIETDLTAIPPVPCRIGELNQVFLNLLVNAAHAVAEAGRGRGIIRVATRREEDVVVVSIADSGGGIPAANSERIFDPFFTTKPVGKGTGQGLTLARTIVVKHGGTLTFTSSPQRGTTFEIRLPLAET